jgi:MMP 1-O-methyltransferase
LWKSGPTGGLSTIALTKESLRGRREPVYAIEPHEYNRNQCPGEDYGPQDNIAFSKNVLFSGLAGIIRPIHLPSSEAIEGWEKSITLLWIDGNHEYEAVRMGFALWSSFVLPGEYLAFHDSSESGSGPFRVIQEALKEGKYIFQKRANKVPVLEKQGFPISLEARARNLPTEAIEVCT